MELSYYTRIVLPQYVFFATCFLSRYLIKLQFLQELNLSENLIKRFPNCLHLMEKLQVLRLHSNLIEKLPKQTSGY